MPESNRMVALRVTAFEGEAAAKSRVRISKVNPMAERGWLGPVIIAVVGVAYSLLGYQLTLKSGYFDDSLFVVAVARSVPTEWTQAAQSLLNASGDTYAPFLFGLAWIARQAGILGNGSMNAIGGLGLTAMSLAVYFLLRRMSIPRLLATAGALLALLTPALVDQRVWFVSIQHTFTVTLLVVAVTCSLGLLAEARVRERRGRVLAHLVVLDAALTLLAFGREIVLGASVLGILAITTYALRPGLRVVVAVAWLLPLPILLRAVLTGRAGTQVAAVGVPGMDSSLVGGATSILDRYPGWVFLILAGLVVAIQAFGVRRHFQRSPHVPHVEHTFPRPRVTDTYRRSLALLLTVGAGVAAIVAAPRVVTMVAAATPGPNLAVEYGHEFASRWAMLIVPAALWVAMLAAVLALVTTRPYGFETAFLAMSMLAVTPYLASNFMEESVFSWEEGLPVHSLSRYVIYLVPAAVLAVAMGARRPWRRYPTWTAVAAVVLVIATALSSYLATEQRVDQTQAVVIVEEGPGVLRIVPTSALRQYRVGYGDSLPGQILGDYGALTDDQGLSSESLGAEVLWNLE